MPYKKTYRKRRRRKRHWGYKSYNRGLSLASKALAVSLATKKLLNVEYKTNDVVQNATAITNTGIVQDLVLIGNGTGDTNREGNQVKVTSILLKYYLSQNSSATDTTVRVILTIDKQANAQQATLTAILNDSTAVANIVSPNNLNNKYRFTTLYNRLHQMSINGRRSAMGKYYKRIDLPIRYNGSGSTISNVTTNNIQLWFISDETTNTPLVESHCRVRYIDN